jgi:hypothetical protein
MEKMMPGNEGETFKVKLYAEEFLRMDISTINEDPFYDDTSDRWTYQIKSSLVENMSSYQLKYNYMLNKLMEEANKEFDENHKSIIQEIILGSNKSRYEIYKGNSIDNHIVKSIVQYKREEYNLLNNAYILV